MAQLKDLLVSGPTRFIGDVYVNKLIKTGGTSDDILLADGTTTSLEAINSSSTALQNYLPLVGGKKMTGDLELSSCDLVFLAATVEKARYHYNDEDDCMELQFT